jgi:hypothetical protein
MINLITTTAIKHNMERLGKGMIHAQGGKDGKDVRFHCDTQNGKQFKT